MENTPEGFIEKYMLYNENTEIPPVFSLWGALFTLGAAMGRRYYLDMGAYVNFPNNYILFVA